MNWPCSIAINCPPCDQNPVRNISVVDADPQTCFSLAYSSTPPVLGNTDARHCTRWCYWTVEPGSPANCIPDAWVCAQREADNCTGDTFLNSEQKCSKPCPNGTIVSYTVPDGQFAGANQAEADANAMGYACLKVDQMMTWACDITQVHLSDFTCCTVTCPGGINQTACLPAGAFQGATKAEANALANAAACAQAQSQCLPVPTRPCNAQQECTVSCPDGTYYSYVVPANTYCADTQADADAMAYNFACAMAQQGCHSALVPNTPQICTITCPDTSTVTLTIPAAYFFAVDQQSANLLAYNYACNKAASFCPGQHYKRNTAQICCVPCPDGTVFCQTTPANLFFAVTQAEANRLAYNAACQRAHYYKICISDITNDRCCVNEGPCTGSFEATGIDLDAHPLWYVASGSVPPGMALQADPTFGNIARITGTPTLTGTYPITILFVNTSDGRSITKPFTIYVQGIDNASPLPAATQGTAYTLQLTNNVGSGHYTWALESGTLPAGLNLNTTSGKITGTPTTPGSSTFSISVTDTGHGDLKCTKSFDLQVVAGGFINVPLRIYHGTDAVSKGTWFYGVNYAGKPTLLYQSREMVFDNATKIGPYSDTGLTVSLPVGTVDVTLDIKPETESTPIAHHVHNITASTRLLAYDRRAEGSGADIVLDNALFEAATLPDYCVGDAYNAAVGIWTGGSPTYSITVGSLPTGMSMDAAGLITGTPTVDVGQCDFTVTVTDGVDTESCPFTIYSCSQSVYVTGTIEVPDHFARWDGIFGAVTMSPVGSHFITVTGKYMDNGYGGFTFPVIDSYIVDGFGATGNGYMQPVPGFPDVSHAYQLSLEQDISAGNDWKFGLYHGAGYGFSVRIPIVDETGDSGLAFDGTKQFSRYNSGSPIPVDGSTVDMDLFIFSNYVAALSGPVGSYDFYLQSLAEWLGNSDHGANQAPGSDTHITQPIGTITVT